MQREVLYLQDIIESIAAIERFLQTAEKSGFLASELLQSAVVHKPMIIGEASARLTDDLKNRYPQTPRKQIIGLRNIVAHAYSSIDYAVIWLSAANRLETLREEVILILQTDFSDFELRAND